LDEKSLKKFKNALQIFKKDSSSFGVYKQLKMLGENNDKIQI
jgi:hypothetical protein